MILTGNEIYKCVKKGQIRIDPFDKYNLNPNSYNFRLNNILMKYKYNDFIDVKNIPKTTKIIIPKTGIVLEPNQLYLGCSYEKMGSDNFVPFIEGRSSTGRLGLFIHITAPLGDIGFFGQWTLQLKATIAIKVYPFQNIGQIMFHKVAGEISLYSGKYQYSIGPQWSKLKLDV